jgi:hypothetical protein
MSLLSHQESGKEKVSHNNSSLLEIHKQIYDSFALDPYNSLIP